MAEDDELPDLAELRAHDAGRQEVLRELQVRDELAQLRDKRLRALLVSFLLLAGLAVPYAACVIGVSVRLFKWAAGY